MTLSELEEEARKRRQRLSSWKTKQTDQSNKRKEYEDFVDEQQSNENDRSTDQQDKTEFPKPIFRNYKPNDAGILSGSIVLPRPKLVDIKSVIDESRNNASSQDERRSTFDAVSSSENVDLTSLAPRKADCDLKRDVQKKLERLEKRTNRCLVELTRERLLDQNRSSQSSLAEVVATSSRLNDETIDDDD